MRGPHLASTSMLATSHGEGRGEWISAAKDFRDARARASREEILGRVSGKPTELLCYSDVPEQIRAARTSSRNLQDIPIDVIVGSVGRCTDFTRSFLPLQDSDKDRWAHVELAWNRPVGLPPIEVYQIGQVYFVLDGNHRVSVARQLGAAYVQAYVTELKTNMPLSPDDRPDDLIVKAEYAQFLERTRLDELRPDADLSMSVPGHYRELEEQISAHRHAIEAEMETETDGQTSYEEAVARWYDEVYLPVARVIRERRTLRDFPGRTETDLYVWTQKHRAELIQGLGLEIGPDTAACDLVDKLSPRPKHVFARAMKRLAAVLRRDKRPIAPGCE